MEQKLRLAIREEIERLHNEGQLEEGWLGRMAGILGLSLASLAGVMAQGGDISGLQDKYDQNTLNKLETAMENPQVLDKLEDMGYSDNNIERAVKRLKGKKISKFLSVDRSITP